ncbi:sulfotransferase [Jiella sp. MQZ9-1]|uniref:Sulfotransferase n=1 Tax=Jiella flava TaxID=2816857 RepID=A0A939JW09_9HYPH|nr:sulfotransferase [Jiella flava]MBO0663019.1 sulfotransferase [Jiella flava]MCD2471438.1 sulfotransferase [Jiella flava]
MNLGDAHAPMLIHIGYHKTGSTFLQTQVFSSSGRGFYMDPDRSRTEIVRDIVWPDVFDFDPAAARQRYLPSLGEAREAGATLVLSHERLSGYPGNGGFDRRQTADRLAATFPEAKILIVLREQRALLRSMYSQYVTDGGDASIDEFLALPQPRLGRMPHFRLSTYDFDRLILHYQSLFSPERVLVLPFEMFCADPQDFCDRIGGFCGHPPRPLTDTASINEKRPLLMQQAQRFANRHFSRNELSASALLDLKSLPKGFRVFRRAFEAVTPRQLETWMSQRLMRSIARVVGDYYAASNARTAALTGLDLTAYGYPVGDRELRHVDAAGRDAPHDEPGWTRGALEGLAP